MLGHHLRGVRVEPLHQHGELVAAQPRDDRVVAGRFLQAAPDDGEHLVADEVAMALVERAEVVHVEEEDRYQLVGGRLVGRVLAGLGQRARAGAVEGDAQALEEHAAVREAGERILVVEGAQPPLIRLVLGQRLPQLEVGRGGGREALEHLEVVLVPRRGLLVRGAEDAEHLAGGGADRDADDGADLQLLAGRELLGGEVAREVAHPHRAVGDQLDESRAPHGARVVQRPVGEGGARGEAAAVVAGEDDEGEGSAKRRGREHGEAIHRGRERPVHRERRGGGGRRCRVDQCAGEGGRIKCHVPN